MKRPLICSIRVYNPGSGGGGGGATPGTGWIGFSAQGTTGVNSVTANFVMVWMFSLGGPWVLNNLWIDIGTGGGAGELYDVGVYSLAGSLLAHAGAQAMTATGWQSFAVSGAPITLPSGTLVAALTGNASTLTINNHWGETGFLNNAWVASTGGALPSSITAPGPVAPSDFTHGFGLS